MFISALRARRARTRDLSHPGRTDTVRLTIVQAGDYADAAARFAAGGDENYYAQKYSVDFVAALAARADIDKVSIITFGADRAQATYRGVETAGVQLYPSQGAPRFAALLQAVARSRPTHLVVAAPLLPVIRWGLQAGCQVMPLFADSFRLGGWRSKLRAWRLVRVLNRRDIAFVANHNLAAALDLARIGVARAKILPFDWPELIDTAAFPPKTAPEPDRPFNILYVGQIRETKGVVDAIRAVALLCGRGRAATLDLIGAGDVAAMRAAAVAAGVGDHVRFLGKQSHADVIAAMRAHDAIVVPSHHAYPEGLPMTLYEALAVRTPLVVSDHPMFALRMHDGDTALVHPEKDPAAMADALQRLATDSALYARMSLQAGAALEDYLCPLKWDRLIEAFLSPRQQEILSPFTLANRSYH